MVAGYIWKGDLEVEAQFSGRRLEATPVARLAVGAKKKPLYRTQDTVYIRLQLHDVVNFFKWILGRKS